MKTLNYFRGLQAALVLSGSLGVASCSMDEPFKSENDGDTIVKMNVSFSSGLTRAQSQEDLASGCKVYVSNANGLLHKWVGLQNIPSSVYMRYGSYLAEAYAGDSVPAAFETKYYKGATRFDVGSNQVTTQVSINCKIANVVTTLNLSNFPSYLQDDLNVTISSTSGEIVYTKEKFAEKGYFMRAYDESTHSYDDKLNYVVTGKDIDGSTFTKKGMIENVLPAHEYQLTLLYNAENDKETGGAFIRIEVKEFEVEIDDEIIIHTKPQFAWVNSEMDLTDHIFSNDQNFADQSLLIGAYQDFASLEMSTDNGTLIEALGGNNKLDLIQMTSEVKQQLEAKGLGFLKGYNGLDCNYKLTLTGKWLNALPSSEEEYAIEVTAIDRKGLSNNMTIRIANTEAAKGVPFELDTDFWRNDLFSIGVNKAEIKLNLNDKSIRNLAIQYKKTDEEVWKIVNLTDTRAAVTSYTLTGLEENTEYEIRIVGGEITDGNYQYVSGTSTFKTEERYIIPNGNMEDWHEYQNAWEPSPKDNLHNYWDTGNDAMRGTTKLTEPTSQYKHGGEYSAMLASKTILIQLGAGNLFVGDFLERVGTSGAKINFGKPYNGSHPTKLKFYAKYISAKVNFRGNKSPEEAPQKNENDHGQVYVAIASGPSSVNTAGGVYFDPEADNILGYGEITWKDNFGNSDTLDEVNIDINYYPKAKTEKATTLIIVCSASKYGDFFTGGSGSTLYLDDFELVYE